MLVGEVRQAITGMEHIKNAASVIVRFGHMAVQTVTIPSFAGVLAPNLIACFIDMHSQVKMCMEIEANDDTVEWLVRRSEVVPKDLNEDCFVSYMAGSRFRHDIDKVFDAAGVTRELRFETRTTDAIYHLVGRGMGVSIVGTSHVAFDILGSVVVSFKAQLEMQLVLIWVDNRHLSALAQDFLDMVRGRAKSG